MYPRLTHFLEVLVYITSESPCRFRQQFLPNRRRMSSALYDVTWQETVTFRYDNLRCGVYYVFVPITCYCLELHLQAW